MNRYFGYARISTPQQSIERQIRNILAAYPQSEIIREVFTGTKFQGRREFEKLLKKLNAGDTIIFDSVSRMSRDAEEGFTMYEDLFSKGINNRNNRCDCWENWKYVHIIIPIIKKLFVLP